jgi:HD-GYP domain-containing protein (c-di-GMP phosphodiesterase class II)
MNGMSTATHARLGPRLAVPVDAGPSGADRRRLPVVLTAAAVAATAIVVFALVDLTGGLPNVLVNLGYVPVFLGALGFGLRGGAVAGLLMALVIGPLGAWAGLSVDAPMSWAVRGTMFVVIGSLNGALVDRTRRSVDAWSETVNRVTERERSGILALARGAEAKDEQTGDHLRRVQLTAEELARATGAGDELAADIGRAAMLHDVGKLHVPDGILQKRGPLTEDEWVIVRNHTVWGEQILGDSEGFELARRVARWHHENVDGSGYPDGLRGDLIPLEARIVRIADSFDAMTNRRPYSKPRTWDAAIEELFRYRGTQFDPELVELMEVLLTRDPLRTRLLSMAPPPSSISGRIARSQAPTKRARTTRRLA